MFIFHITFIVAYLFETAFYRKMYRAKHQIEKKKHEASSFFTTGAPVPLYLCLTQKVCYTQFISNVFNFMNCA